MLHGLKMDSANQIPRKPEPAYTKASRRIPGLEAVGGRLKLLLLIPGLVIILHSGRLRSLIFRIGRKKVTNPVYYAGMNDIRASPL